MMIKDCNSPTPPPNLVFQPTTLSFYITRMFVKKLSNQLPFFPLSSLKRSDVAFLLMVSGWIFVCPWVWADEPVLVQTKALSELAVYPESSAPAVAISLNDTSITTQIDAQVLEVLVRVGDQVKAGAVLARLACQDFELEHSRLQAERQANQARLELARWQLQQTETLAEQQTIPQEQVQEKRSQLAVLRGDLAANEARLAISARHIAQCDVKAPFAGVVTARLMGVGQFALRNTPLLRLLDTDHSEVSAQVASRETPAVSKARTLVFEHNGTVYPLKLRVVLPTILTETGSQEVRLDFSDRKAGPGAAGRLLWRTPNRYIGTDLLVKRDGQLGVFIVTNNVAHFQALPDAQQGSPAIIGLSPDTPIVVSGQYGLNDGVKVRVQGASTQPIDKEHR